VELTRPAIVAMSFGSRVGAMFEAMTWKADSPRVRAAADAEAITSFGAIKWS
jgi:hypothetical protein